MTHKLHNTVRFNIYLRFAKDENDVIFTFFKYREAANDGNTTITDR